MPNRRTPRALTATRPHGTGGNSVQRDYSALRYRGPTPSDDFDWDRALYLNALTLRELGYRLTPEQQKRIDDHD